MNINNLFIRRAIQEAGKSVMHSRHGAVLIQGHKIKAVGHNHNDRAFIHGRTQLPSVHAEIDCSRMVFQGKKGKGGKGGQGFEGKERKSL